MLIWAEEKACSRFLRALTGSPPVSQSGTGSGATFFLFATFFSLSSLRWRIIWVPSAGETPSFAPDIAVWGNRKVPSFSTATDNRTIWLARPATSYIFFFLRSQAKAVRGGYPASRLSPPLFLRNAFFFFSRSHTLINVGDFFFIES